MTTEDGLPANLKEKSDAFVASAAFENMVQCFAAEIAKGSVQKSKISRSTMKSGWLQADRTVYIYVTTDCAQIRAEFAERIKSAVVVRLASNHDGPKMLQKLSPLSFIGNSTQEHRLVPPLVEVSDWKVAVDYFNGNLSAAHFFVWTMPNKEMKEVRAKISRLIEQYSQNCTHNTRWLYFSCRSRTGGKSLAQWVIGYSWGKARPCSPSREPKEARGHCHPRLLCQRQALGLQSM